jgi:hypothetical protein
MSSNQIAKSWREYFVNKLQERYGLAGKEARKKADAWMQWLREQPSLKPETPTAAGVRHASSGRRKSATA